MKRTHLQFLPCFNRKWLTPFLLISTISLISLLIAMNPSSRSNSHPPHSKSDSISGAPAPEPPRFAYFLSGTRGDAPRLRRLLQAAYHPRNSYLLHLDLEASDAERLELAKHVKSWAAVRQFGNVMVVGNANLVTYKGPTVVASMLHAVAILLKQAEWDWFINLSASDYPLLPQDEGMMWSSLSCVPHKVLSVVSEAHGLGLSGFVLDIRDNSTSMRVKDLLHIFSYLPRDLNFLEHTSNIGWKEFQRARPIIIDPGLYHSKKSGVFWAKEKRSLPSSFKLFMGSDWMVLTRSFLEFSIWGWDNLPRTLLLYYANVLSSTEGYFHTVICNNKDYQNTTVNHDLHYIRWDNPPKQQPMNLTLEHFDDMVQSGAPFARNFARDDPVLDKIDKELLRRSDARFTPGGWCVGDSRVLDKDPCLVHGSPHAVKPSLGSRRLEKLVLKLLHSDNFRTKQCK
ncbi:beta-glucuronosyltransferase GlcAT14C isoform X1 [Diospyros lotus]|uniref:beta-glucuronosyltransferase GlcAT14C isoform X1 n=1 Tax=Diospyros lotus TaxID=55363 RepID=UPI00224E4B0C|nr:beta-glucuronosyltransferase GlcAT14C isoform X1 [Diospyros lotus]